VAQNRGLTFQGQQRYKTFTKSLIDIKKTFNSMFLRQLCKKSKCFFYSASAFTLHNKSAKASGEGQYRKHSGDHLWSRCECVKFLGTIYIYKTGEMIRKNENTSNYKTDFWNNITEKTIPKN
jgi:hypothetical protein